MTMSQILCSLRLVAIVKSDPGKWVTVLAPHEDAEEVGDRTFAAEGDAAVDGDVQDLGLASASRLYVIPSKSGCAPTGFGCGRYRYHTPYPQQPTRIRPRHQKSPETIPRRIDFLPTFHAAKHTPAPTRPNAPMASPSFTIVPITRSLGAVLGWPPAASGHIPHTPPAPLPQPPCTPRASCRKASRRGGRRQWGNGVRTPGTPRVCWLSCGLAARPRRIARQDLSIKT